MQGEPAPTPVVLNDRAYTIRVRFPESTRSVGRRDQEHAAGQRRPAGPARSARSATVEEIPGQTEVRRENLQRNVTVTARLEGVDLGAGVAAAQRAIADLHLPPAIRVAYGGAYEEQQKSFQDLLLVLVLAVAAGVHRAAVRVRRLRRADRGRSRRRCCRPSACSWRCW